MESGYNKEKLLEAFGALEEEIGEIEEKTHHTLREKQNRDGKRKELHEVERELDKEKKLAEQAVDIDKLLSYAGENTLLSVQHKERAAGLEKRRDRLKQAVKTYEKPEQIYTDAATTDKCLRLYRRLCKQMRTANGNAGNVQEELNQRAAKYLPRKDALGIGIRLIGLSEGMRAAKNLKKDDGSLVNLTDYIRMTAEMLDDYIMPQKLKSQGENRLRNVLATLYMWLIVVADVNTAQTCFNRLDSLHISWNQEECPGRCFERLYQLNRQNKATLVAFRLLGYQELVDVTLQTDTLLMNRTAIDVVREYLDAIESGREYVDDGLLGSAKEILSGYMQVYIQTPVVNTLGEIQNIYVRLEDVALKLGKFRGKPYFKEMEEAVSAVINAYYDREFIRQEIYSTYRRYIVVWMSRNYRTRYDDFNKARELLAEYYPLDELNKEIESHKKHWVIWPPAEFYNNRINKERDVREQIATLKRVVMQHDMLNGKYAIEVKTILEDVCGEKSDVPEDGKKEKRKVLKNSGSPANLQEVRAGADRRLSLKWMLLAVLAPFNLIPMVIFEFALFWRSFMVFGTQEDEDKKLWVKKVNRRLNLIAAVAMCLFYFTGGYGVGEYYDTMGWLFSILPDGFYMGILTVIVCMGCGFVLIPYFAWTVFTGLFDLLGDILERNVKNERAKM